MSLKPPNSCVFLCVAGSDPAAVWGCLHICTVSCSSVKETVKCVVGVGLIRSSVWGVLGLFLRALWFCILRQTADFRLYVNTLRLNGILPLGGDLQQQTEALASAVRFVTEDHGQTGNEEAAWSFLNRLTKCIAQIDKMLEQKLVNNV